MKKVLSFICALSVVATMFVGLATTASAAEKLTAGLKFNGYEFDSTYNEYLASVECLVTIPGSLSEYAEGRTGVTGRAIQSIAINATYAAPIAGYNMNDYKITNTLGANNTAITIKDGAIVYAWIESTDTSKYYYGSDNFSMGTAKVVFADPAVGGTVSFKSSENGINLRGAVSEALVQSDFTFGTYDDEGKFTEGMTLTIPSYNEWSKSDEEEATAETIATWDTEDGLLVIAKLLKADAAEYGVSIKDYTLPETSSKAGFGPDFPMIDANKPSAAGYYGINIIGIAAGDYEVAAYADDVYADYTTVTVQ